MAKIDNTVGRVLNGRRLITLAPEQTVRDAATILSSHSIGAAPVLSGHELIGVLTERDVLQRVVAAGRDPDLTKVSEVMTPAPRTVSRKSSLVEAFAIMAEGHFRHLPVVEGDGQVVAMLSMRDVPLKHRVMYQQWIEWTTGENGKPIPAA